MSTEMKAAEPSQAKQSHMLKPTQPQTQSSKGMLGSLLGVMSLSNASSKPQVSNDSSSSSTASSDNSPSQSPPVSALLAAPVVSQSPAPAPKAQKPAPKPMSPSKLRNVKQAESLMEQFQAMSRLVFNHSLAINTEVDVFLASFEDHFGRRDVYNELPTVESYRRHVNDKLADLHSQVDQPLKDILTQLQSATAACQEQLAKSQQFQTNFSQNEARSSEELTLAKREMLENFAASRERLINEHKTRMSEMVAGYRPQLDPKPQLPPLLGAGEEAVPTTYSPAIAEPSSSSVSESSNPEPESDAGKSDSEQPASVSVNADEAQS